MLTEKRVHLVNEDPGGNDIIQLMASPSGMSWRCGKQTEASKSRLATGNHEQAMEWRAEGSAHTQGLSFAATENSARTCGRMQSDSGSLHVAAFSWPGEVSRAQLHRQEPRSVSIVRVRNARSGRRRRATSRPG